MRALLAIALAACTHTRVIVIRDPCSPRAFKPAVQCTQGQLDYDGCRWTCTLSPIEQPPAHLSFDFQGYRAEGQ